jgi:hypothetical protein
MEANLSVAIVTAASTSLVAVVALVINSGRFADMGKRIDDLNARMGRLEGKLDHIEELLVGYALDVTRIKEKLGI